MARQGTPRPRMMKQTAGVQANLDYSSEADAMRKLRVAMGIVPSDAMFANSSARRWWPQRLPELPRPYLGDPDPEMRQSRVRLQRARGFETIPTTPSTLPCTSSSALTNTSFDASPGISSANTGARIRQGARDPRGLGRSSHHHFPPRCAEEVYREPQRDSQPAHPECSALPRCSRAF